MGFRSVKALVDDKKELIADQLKDSLPTVVISLESGIFVFSEQIEKVHSTVVLAGVGSGFVPLSQWFREQIMELRKGWADNVPRAAIDGKILISVLNVNSTPSRSILYADAVLIEVKPKFGEDVIHRYGFWGGVRKFSCSAQWVSYNAVDLEEEEDKERLYTEMEKFGTSPEAFKADETTVSKLRTSYPGKIAFLNRSKLIAKNFYHVFEDVKTEDE